MILKEKQLETRNAGSHAWAAAQDAGRYSDECRATYSNSDRAKAEVFMDLVRWAYAGKNFYLTYRKGFISIKLTDPIVRERKYAREIDAICHERGYEKVRTPQGLTFRMPKVVDNA